MVCRRQASSQTTRRRVRVVFFRTPSKVAIPRWLRGSAKRVRITLFCVIERRLTPSSPLARCSPAVLLAACLSFHATLADAVVAMLLLSFV